MLIKKVKILDKYLDISVVFSEKKTLVLPEYIKFNEHAIDLKDGKQPLYRPINSLGLIELEILKTYIKTYLKSKFIRLFQSSASVSILFDKKLDGSFHPCINYQGFNNLIIKNRYLLPLIGESLDQLSWVKRFT